MNEQAHKYRKIFFSTLYLSAFTFGGGYVIVTLLKQKFVDELHWIDDEEMLDLVAIAQSSPGPIAVNGATFVGNQVAGIPGGVIATLGVILPSCLFVTVLAWLYAKYRNLSLMQGVLQSLRPAVVSMIFTAGVSILLPTLFANGTISFLAGNFQLRAALLFAAALVCLRRFKMNPILVMTGCGAVGALRGRGCLPRGRPRICRSAALPRLSV